MMQSTTLTIKLATIASFWWLGQSAFDLRAVADEVDAKSRDFAAEAEAARRPHPLDSVRGADRPRRVFGTRRQAESDDLFRSPAEPAAIPQSDGTDLPAEIQHLRRSLGGSQVDRFPSLRQGGRGSRAAATFPFKDPSEGPFEGASPTVYDAARVLREAASQLDQTANRLEQLDLYRQADGLRQQAQGLRVDARRLLGPPQGEVELPTPAVWEGDRPAVPPMSDIAPTPTVEPPATLADPPTLEPVPQPQIPADPPKPQPLLDSPELSPQPDVEVEG